MMTTLPFAFVVAALAAPALLPSIAADGRSVFLENQAGHVEAVDQATGAVRWTSVDSGPVLAADGKLVFVFVHADAAAMAVAFLDAQTGKRTQLSQPIALPSWAIVGPAHGRSFSISGRIENGALLVSWSAHAFYTGGVQPSPEMMRDAQKDAAGVVAVDVVAGAVSTRTSSSSSSLGAAPAGFTSSQYYTGAAWSTAPFVVDDVVSALAVARSSDGVSTLTLKRVNRVSGAPLGSVLLLRGREPWVRITEDGRHIVVHQAVPPASLPVAERLRTVFALDTGVFVMTLPLDDASAALAIVGARAFDLAGGRVHAYANGKPLWDRPVYVEPVLPPMP